MYHEENQFAHKNEIHPLRDQLEAAFISSYVKDGKGIFYAFCRGHQLTGVTQGSRLIQDLYAEHVTETEHRGGTFHKIKIQPGSLMSRMTGGLSEVTVNSLHHQAVDGAPKGWIVSAQEQGGGSSKPVIETLENKSKCAITFQFHPEGMNDGIGGKILWEMVQYARETHLVGRPKQVNH
jgi:putative glutamine amidotransferase